MKLNIIDKCIVGVLVILVATAIINICSNLGTYLRLREFQAVMMSHVNEPYNEVKTLPKNIQELSQKHNAFVELFNSKEKTFAFNMEKNIFRDSESFWFAKRIKERLAKESNLNYRVVSDINWVNEEMRIDLAQKKFIDGKQDACEEEKQKDREIQIVVQVAEDCLSSACIIDIPNHKYIKMSKKVDYVIEQLQANNPPTKAN